MIGISKITSDAAGAVVFKLLPDSNLEAYERRVSRIKTLDGGCVITDSGYSDSDRTIRAIVRYDEQKYCTIKTIFQNNAIVNIALRDGLYSGAMQSLSINENTIRVTVLVKERLDS